MILVVAAFKSGAKWLYDSSKETPPHGVPEEKYGRIMPTSTQCKITKNGSGLSRFLRTGDIAKMILVMSDAN